VGWTSKRKIIRVTSMMGRYIVRRGWGSIRRRREHLPWIVLVGECCLVVVVRVSGRGMEERGSI
jgi:hypothetical protein